MPHMCGIINTNQQLNPYPANVEKMVS